MPVTLTGDDNYSGVYTDVDVLGGATAAGTTSTDMNAFAGLDPNGKEYFLFGNLHAGSHTTSTGDVTSGSYNTTATGDSGDTLVFDFTFDPGHAGGASNFLTSSFALSGGLQNGDQPSLQPDIDGDADYQSTAAASAWTTQYNAWVASLGPGYTFSGPASIETSVSNGHPDPDVNVTLDVTATAPGSAPTLTSDYAGVKVLLGFAVGSDHLSLDGHSTITQDEFNQFFEVTASSHLSANNNTVNDTIIGLDDHTWSIDLYGVNVGDLTTAYNALHGTTLSTGDYVFDFILSH
ncbi:MAG TPA: hypothetical protein VLI41_06780 [Phenylobacterium sp.]|uniref:hypothetical protein n=1 Tax=Phenylobacterium sp. TaxID=1871053 RepID=UPI002C83F3A6|nr:hypothetical protein [Phenylobacterium sp.]HSV02895.1 hypothetical protein [Phenylobacterium sp.]